MSLARHARMLEATKPVVFAEQRQRPHTWFYTPPEIWDRCSDCAAQVQRNHATSVLPLDRARDRALAIRDCNEALSILALETLSHD